MNNSILQVLGIQVAHAISIGPTGTPPSSNDNVSFITTVTNIGGGIINMVFVLGGVLAVLYIMWAGLQYITSAGSPEKAKLARGAIINGMIGVVIIIAVFFFIRLATTIGQTLAGF